MIIWKREKGQTMEEKQGLKGTVERLPWESYATASLISQHCYPSFTHHSGLDHSRQYLQVTAREQQINRKHYNPKTRSKRFHYENV